MTEAATSTRRPLRVLALYWHPKGSEMRLAVRQQLHLLDGRGLPVVYRNAIDPAPSWLVRTEPDLCILHTTFLGVRWDYDFEDYRRRFGWIARLACPKIGLPQDEYDHAEALEEWLLELGVTSVYSCLTPEQWPTLYPLLSERVALHQTLTGFVDEDAAAALAGHLTPHSQRPLDVVYRAKQLPYWFGSHGQLKHRIAEAVQDRASCHGLRTDISTRPEDTVYGTRWLDFLLSGRAVIGAESGSSVLDPRGEIQRRISGLLAEEPDLTFDEVDARMPSGWDSYAFFAISPRHLEAVITKTAQVLVEGRYSGVLEPERHYIPVKSDFSNLDEALERLSDVEAVEAMTERAYQDVYLSGRNNLSVLADQLCAEARPRPRGRTGVALPFALARRRSLPVRQPLGGKPLRQLFPHIATLAEALVRYREARTLLLAAVRGRLSTPLEGVIREVILLRILARIRDSAGDQPWWLSVKNTAGTVVIRTEVGAQCGSQPRVDEAFGYVAWNHSAVAQAVPIYPRHPSWGWVALGPSGRYEFTALAEIARTDAATARALVAHALER